MIHLRRLRAVLLLSVVSGIAWGTLLVMGILGARLIEGEPLLSEPILTPFLIFGFLGLIAGGFFSLGLGLASSRGHARVSRWSGALFGLVSGGLVSLGLFLTLLGDSRLGNVITPLLTLTAVGGVVGLTICHIAARKELPSPVEPVALPPA